MIGSGALKIYENDINRKRLWKITTQQKQAMSGWEEKVSENRKKTRVQFHKTFLLLKLNVLVTCSSLTI